MWQSNALITTSTEHLYAYSRVRAGFVLCQVDYDSDLLCILVYKSLFDFVRVGLHYILQVVNQSFVEFPHHVQIIIDICAICGCPPRRSPER